MRIPADLRTINCRRFCFNPCGKINFYGSKQVFNNPPRGKRRWGEEKENLAGRLVVGLSVQDTKHKTKKYAVEDIMNLVKVVRKKQYGIPDSSFISQRGIYTHKSSGKIIDEDSVQVVIFWQISVLEPDKEIFKDNMRALAELLAEKFYQEEVILEVQKNGVSQFVEGWGASPRRKQ